MDNLKYKPDTLAYYQNILTRVDECLDYHTADPVGVAQIADSVNVSYHHLAEIFCALRGESLGAHIKRKKLERAITLYSYTALNLGQVADKTGFATKHSLSKSFSQYFNRSPAAVKKASLYHKASTNILYDGITSASHYDALMQMDVDFSYREETLQGCYFTGTLTPVHALKLVNAIAYDDYVEQLVVDDACKNTTSFFIKAFDSVNFTPLKHYRMLSGMFHRQKTQAQLKAQYPQAFISPVKDGRYLVFKVPNGDLSNIKCHITLFRENIIRQKQLFVLNDFYDFFLFTNTPDALGDYYIYYGN
nr:helix-turn-helix domain-containing protein [uncultured Mucilaginibacter sp.]